jgi:Ca2+-binding RTX toxin-like protein
MTSGMTRGDIDGGAGQDLVKYGAYQQLGGWLQLENRGEHGAWGHDVTAVEHVQGNRFNNKVTDATGKANVLEGLGGDDELHGNGGEDALNGGPGEDKLFGGADADTINGGKGHDILQGEGGNDVLIVDGDDRMGIRDGSTKGHVDGGWGTDWVHIQDGADLNGWLQLESRGAHGPWGHDVTAVENARGNDLANKMVDATDRDNTLVGEGGDDELHGKGGSDALNGGPGDDVMHGGSGNDTLIVEGDDSLDLRPNSSEGDVHGGPGSNDWVKIQQGADLDGWLQLETVGHHGPWGHDVTGVENAEGNGGPNKIVDATHNDNVLHGKGGDDELHGKGGNDIIRGGSGQDVMHGDTGDDIIYAEPSDDPAAIEGGVGDDTLVLTDDQMSKSVWMSHTSGFEDVMYGA